MDDTYLLRLQSHDRTASWSSLELTGLEARQVLQQLQPRIRYPHTSLSICSATITGLPEICKAFPHTTRLSITASGRDTIRYLGTPRKENEVLGGPMPRLKEIAVDKSSFHVPEDVVTMVKNRSGGANHLASGEPLELPDGLERLIFRNDCAIEGILLLRLRAMLGEGSVEWEEEEEDDDEAM